MNDLWNTTFPIIKVYNKDVSYSAHSWNRQVVRKFLLDYDGLRIIECMLIIHYNNQMVHDLTLELSNMYNCVVGCAFCASGNLSEKVVLLKYDDYIKQLNTCIKFCDINPYNFSNFYISFYGIGEPSVVCEEISNAINHIKNKYTHAQFNIATFGFNEKCFQYWKDNTPNIRTLQIPYYSNNQEILHSIVRNLPPDYAFIKILKKALLYKNQYNDCRVKINYIVIQKINDRDEDINSLLETLYPYINNISIRISYLNYTKIGKDNNLFSGSTSRINQIYNIFKTHGFDCYIFGSEQNIEVGCGQLVQDYISIG